MKGMRLPRRKGPAGPVHAVRRTGQPGPRFNYELFNCNNFNIRYWSWNYRGCWPIVSLLDPSYGGSMPSRRDEHVPGMAPLGHTGDLARVKTGALSRQPRDKVRRSDTPSPCRKPRGNEIAPTRSARGLSPARRMFDWRQQRTA